MKNREIVDAFNFALAEVRRLHEMAMSGTEGARAALAECGLAGTIRAGRHDIPLGRAAERRLMEVAQARIDGDPDIFGRVWLTTYLRPLQEEIGHRFIIRREAVDETSVREVLKAAKAGAMRQMSTRRYYLPVLTILENGVVDFTIGPVRFERTKSFFEREQRNWDASMDHPGERTAQSIQQVAGRLKWTREFFTTAQREMERAGWIASVEIPDAEEAIGWSRAQSIIDLSCCILRLFAPSSDGSFLGLASQSPAPSEVRISTEADGRLEPSRWGNVSSMPVVEGFLADLKGRALDVGFLEEIVEQAAKWQQLSPGGDRLLVALRWFGEAWKDQHPQAQLVKFATCLESLLTTGGKEGITETLAERYALLTESDFAAKKTAYEEVREIYAARSKAVHGDEIRGKRSLPTLNRKAEKVARQAVLVFAQLCRLLPQKSNLNEVLSEFFVTCKLGGFEMAVANLRKARQAESIAP